jgi:(R,R)-butanediol dehydrogenase/meso-butanediol dehydrogenase/diacetyl reductase
MKAARLHGVQDIRFETVDVPPRPEADQVLLRIISAGICGSDIHNYRTGCWITRTPSIPGHEFAGEVAAVGPGVRTLKAGDRVVADSRYWCGACEACLSGSQHLCQTLGFVGEVCDGGFAEYATLPEHLLMKIGPQVSMDVAATAEPLAVALHAVSRLDPTTDAPVLVTGCGMIGALSALVLARSGFGPVLVADRNAERARLVADVTGGRVVDLTAESLGPDVSGVIEATGSGAVLQALPRLVAGGCRIALVGIFHGGVNIDPTVLVEREVSLIGCHAFKDELPDAVARLGDHAEAISGFLDTSNRLEDVPEAYRRIMAGEAMKPKTIIHCA